MSKNVLRPSQRVQTQKIDTLPKGIANRHLKVLDKCNIAINGKWLKDFLFTNIKKTKKPVEQPKQQVLECKGKKNRLEKKKQPFRNITEGKENCPQHQNIEESIRLELQMKKSVHPNLNRSQQLPPHVLAQKNNGFHHQRKFSCEIRRRPHKRKNTIAKCENNSVKEMQTILELNPWDYEQQLEDEEMLMNI